MFKSPKILKWFYPNRVWGISVSSPTVFLTFDDGPDPEITPWLLDFLSEQDVKATFFCVGANCIKYPELHSRILEDGHAIGNHTMNHENGFKTSNEDYLKSIHEASKVVQSDLFRPPYGRMKKTVEKNILVDFRIVMWSWLSYDYDRKVSSKKIIEEASEIESGDILVFHDNKKTKDRLKEILPPVVAQLKKRSIKFEKIS